jgi:hypothetical protein
MFFVSHREFFLSIEKHSCFNVMYTSSVIWKTMTFNIGFFQQINPEKKNKSELPFGFFPVTSLGFP